MDIKKRQQKRSPWTTVEYVIRIGFSLAWGVVTLGVLIGKFVMEDFNSYATHFTNWNWTLTVLFFLSDVLSHLEGLAYRQNEIGPIRSFLCTYGFWTAYGSAWLVFILVFIMFADNSDVFTSLAKPFGGKYSFGFLLNMNTVFHTLPAMAVAVYLYLNERDIVTAHREYIGSRQVWGIQFLYTFGVLLIPILILAVYNMAIDIRKVYGLDTNLGLLILAAIGIVFAFNGITLLIIKIKVETRDPTPKSLYIRAAQ